MVRTALVRLVEDDRVVAAQLAVAVELGEQHAVGHQLDPRCRGSTGRRSAPGSRRRVPSSTPSSSEMRSAMLRAAMRRGWVWPMRSRPSSRQIFGSWVVLPEPGRAGDDHDLVLGDGARELLPGRADGQLRRVGDRNAGAASDMSPSG